jgi:hypothetical protein
MCAASVIGEPVTVLQFDFDGNERRGLVAKCRRTDGSQYTVSAADVLFPAGDRGGFYIAAYRRWIGLAPYPKRSKQAARAQTRTEAAAPTLDLTGPIEVIVLSVQRLAVRCRYSGSNQGVTLRAKRFCNLAPGEVVSVRPNKHWSYAGNPFLSGEIESTRIDAGALGLTPLWLGKAGTWDPAEEYWGEEGEPIRGVGETNHRPRPRAQFEMEQVLP